jgi:hypothetical protein
MSPKLLGAAVAAALSLAVAAGPVLADEHLDEELSAQLVELGYELDAFADLTEEQIAQIRALFAEDHDEDDLRAAIDQILEDGDTG